MRENRFSGLFYLKNYKIYRGKMEKVQKVFHAEMWVDKREKKIDRGVKVQGEHGVR